MPANHLTFDSALIIVVHDMTFFTGIYIAANSYFVATTSVVLTYGLSIAFHDTTSLLAAIASNTSCALLTSPALTYTDTILLETPVSRHPATRERRRPLALGCRRRHGGEPLLDDAAVHRVGGGGRRW